MAFHAQTVGRQTALQNAYTRIVAVASRSSKGSHTSLQYGALLTIYFSYIDDLHDEIQRLRRASDSPAVVERNQAAPQRGASTDASVASISDSREATPQAAAAGDDTTLADQTGDAVRNPLIDERPWFFPLTPEMPILVGEATDVAFATVLRRELLGHTQSHFPRLQNVNDETICSFWNSDCVWPNPARARFLLKVSLNTVCRRYYLVRKSSTLKLLEQAIRGHPECDMLSRCKLLALFALGEAYSTRTSKSEHQFPGISYYVNASKMLRVLCEKPRIDCVEIIVMLVSRFSRMLIFIFNDTV